MVNRFVKLTPKLCIMGKLLFECFVLAKPTKMKSVGPKNKCVSIFYIIFLVIWITGIAGRLISPLVDSMTNGILSIALKIFGL